MSFEEQKQKVVDFVVNSLIESTHGQDLGIMIVKVAKMMDSLTLPKPPTCASCKHLTRFQHKYKNNGKCNAMGKKLGNIEIANNLTIHNVDYFGCIHHSDYERSNGETK